MKLNLLSEILKLKIKFKYTLNHKIKNNPIEETSTVSLKLNLTLSYLTLSYIILTLSSLHIHEIYP
jgi:hypothetical protein